VAPAHPPRLGAGAGRGDAAESPTSAAGPDGALVDCDTWDDATVAGSVGHPGGPFSLTVETKRIAPGHKKTWYIEAIGLSGGVRFSTADPKTVHVFTVADVAGVDCEQAWQRIEAGSQSVWPTVTGGIFEAGFSDAFLQM
jgi:hypothetical protein